MEWLGEDIEEESSNSTLPSSQGSSPKSLCQSRQSINQAQKALGKIEDSLDNFSPKLGGHIQKIFSGSLVQAERTHCPERAGYRGLSSSSKVLECSQITSAGAWPKQLWGPDS